MRSYLVHSIFHQGMEVEAEKDHPVLSHTLKAKDVSPHSGHLNPPSPMSDSDKLGVFIFLALT